tara:strand:+ start:400 stop:588 length:189 start_codon:yes stop_codon:yes gene_type:complete
MDDLELKTIIMILRDKQTNKPVVITHFTGFETDEEAENFSKTLKEKYINDIPLDDETDPTLH